MFSVLLLVFWTAIGLAFRMIDLTALPPWTDECATIAFSAGHGFRAVPIDQLITTAELTAPLWFDPSSSVRDVWHFLRTESTHPPLYFFLAHYWMRLWSPAVGFGWESREALLWVARSLPALLGAASIPAMFGLARLAWGRSVGAIAITQLAAALMAISPFAISLAREARHYTLVLLFVIGSIACTIAIVRDLAPQTFPTPQRHSSPLNRPQPYAIALAWGLVNACGMATHYFFGLTLAIEAATVFSAIGWWGIVDRRWVGRRGWSVLITAAIPTMIGVIVWIPAWQGLGDNTLTDWVYDGTPGWDAIFRLLSWLTAMFFALPTDDLSLPLGWVIANGLVLLALFLALVRWVAIGVSAMVSSRSWRSRSSIAPITPIAPIALWTILGFVGFGLAAILTLTFGLQSDLTLAIRFSYPYFPALVLLVAIGLGHFWQRGIWQPIAIILIAGFVGATATMFDLTYLQHHRPDHMADVIADRAELPVVLATRHKHHGQTGRLIGVAWELGRLTDRGQTSLNFDNPNTADVRYLLARYADHNKIDTSPPPTSPTPTSGETLRQIVLARSTTIEVWPLNFRATIDWDGTGCEVDRRDRPDVREYDYRRFICPSGRR